MSEPIVQVSPAWAVLAPLALLLFALAGAGLNGALVARSVGRPGRSGASAPLAQVARLLRQRRQVTVAADVLLWRIGAGGLVVVAILKILVIPLGPWTLADLDVGVVWFNTMDVMIWALFWLIGWGANSAHSLVGGYRFLSLAVSYELPLMFALITPAVAARSLRVGDVVAAQHDLWFVIWMPVAFVIFCGSVIAFSSWGPFATAVGRDIAGGFLTDVSGVDRLLILTGRYAVLTAGAAFAVPLFLGGGGGALLPDWLWSIVKTALVLAAFVAIRHRVPTIRPDRFAEVAWIIVLPAALLQVLVVAIIVVGS
ncbi:MAG: NADH-quinone oxidoreductase subunit H [Cryobacterium sp.]|uniref:complex I subunit 1 family protein n=1 Tax=unclassified Cryobacterium TaxID=2649013 RepID=UPI0018C96907|nr:MULTISPECIES: complex I subunit 1 family protein [unclassified Cryobacterium]MCY7403084.1 NADH-quinone oxidoreductase subunit H [Cryobacterium sp.]MEC5155708.1 NADH-quinone oxidoreductase subunit H [Cryobacterium sp. CAN_C3]